MMELNYTKNGDYLIPDIQLSVQEQKPLGKYGRMRRAFLQENNTLLYNHLILTEKLYPHLWRFRDRDRTNGADDGGASESESGTGQEIEPDGLGTAHEHVESAGRGSYSDGTYQQLNFMSLFQSEAEQIQKIDAAAENAAREAESEKPSAFVILRMKSTGCYGQAQF